MASRSAPNDIDAYVAPFPKNVRAILQRIRATIHRAVPGAREVISYRIPAFRQHRVLLYFAAFTNHIGLYPPVSGDPALQRAIARYAGPKGNLRFSLDRPIPYALIARIARLRARQDAGRQDVPKHAAKTPASRSRRRAKTSRRKVSA